MEAKASTNQVVVTISSPEGGSVLKTQESRDMQAESSRTRLGDSASELMELDARKSKVQMSTITSLSSSQERARSSPIASMPPKIPVKSVSRRISLARSQYSKPKSRLLEFSYPDDEDVIEDDTQSNASRSPYRYSPSRTSPSDRTSVPSTPKHHPKSAPITPRTPLIGTPGSEEEDDEEIYKTANIQLSKRSGEKLKFILIEWFAFVIITAFLIASLTVHRLQDAILWGLELWKWCVLVLVIFCGRLFSEWSINVLVFLIEKKFLLRTKVLYFVYGLKKSVQVCIWLGLVLLAWALFNHGVKRSKNTRKILKHVTKALVSCLIGAFIWLIKTLLIKLLASSFQCTRFFDRIQESIFHQYVLQTLSGPPIMQISEYIGSTKSSGQMSFKNIKKGKQGDQDKEEIVNVEKLHKIKQEKVSAWTMKGLVKVINNTGLSTIAGSLEGIEGKEDEQKDKEITSEMEAKAAAFRIFKNVAKAGQKHIEEEDLLRFMKKEEVDNLLPLFEGVAETGKIKKSSLRNWVVNAYLERKSLVHSLNDTKTAIEELNRLFSVVVFVVIIIIWFLLMGLATTKVLVFISSQLLLVAFMFGNTAKTVFEAIIFVFVMHPFDVGDRCVVDGVQMVVEEVNILTTIFLRYDNEKIFYPNTVLSTKPISNFYRSPEMGDSVEFAVDVSTSIEKIGALKARIKAYLESKPKYWRSSHSVLVKEIEDLNKMKMALYVTHTMNFQNYGEKSRRRSELVIELKKFFEDLAIKYHLLPQNIHISSVGSASSPFSFNPL